MFSNLNMHEIMKWDVWHRGLDGNCKYVSPEMDELEDQ